MYPVLISNAQYLLITLYIYSIPGTLTHAEYKGQL